MLGQQWLGLAPVLVEEQGECRIPATIMGFSQLMVLGIMIYFQ